MTRRTFRFQLPINLHSLNRVLCCLMIVSGAWSVVGCSDSSGGKCVPRACEDEGRECGFWDDGCGRPLDCGVCVDPLSACNEEVGLCECLHDTCASGCCAGHERCKENQCVLRGWYEVDLESVHAPDEYTVVVKLSADPSDERAGDVTRYSLSSDRGTLTVVEASYDQPTLTVTLVTERQKLGVTYELSVDTSPEATNPIVESFPAADTAELWVIDFGDPYFSQYLIVAYRAGVGEHSVAYIEEGMSAFDTTETLERFDSVVYPTLTQTFYPAPDMDDNGRILLLGVNGENYFGGYFNQINAYPDHQTVAEWGVHSNEMEIVHVNLVWNTWFMTEVVPHEFSHLLYHARRGFTDTYWEYHDEGLAECAVHLAAGVNQYAINHYTADPNGAIGAGLSLVNWGWGQYDNYVQAYLFWMYLASQTGGLPALTEIFDLDTGSPTEVDEWIQDRLGSTFSFAHQDNLLANWIQADQGPHGYEGLLSFQSANAPTVTPGVTSVSLEPFTGVFFVLADDTVDYPGTQGPDIQYTGISADMTVDFSPPFNVAGGALLVYNTRFDYHNWTGQPSGPDLPALLPLVTPLPPASGLAGSLNLPPDVSPAWLNPPPFNPDRLDRMRRWQRKTLDRIR